MCIRDRSKAIAIFASGGGSNAEKIIEYFADSKTATVSLIVSNNPNAYVLERATKSGIPYEVVTKKIFSDESQMSRILEKHNTDYVILAGFLWLIPAFLIAKFPKRILNIHPALLPAYGGKGMYGKRVHQAVFDNNERESGMTIHYVDEQYDEGQIIHQEKVSLNVTDTPDLIASKVLALEHAQYARVIEKVISS